MENDRKKERRKKQYGEKNIMEKRNIYVLDISKLDQKVVEKRYKNTGFITLDSGRKIPIPEIKKEAYKKYE